MFSLNMEIQTHPKSWVFYWDSDFRLGLVNSLNRYQPFLSESISLTSAELLGVGMMVEGVNEGGDIRLTENVLHGTWAGVSCIGVGVSSLA